MSKMTKWYPADVKPVRVGEYNASMVRDRDLRRWWDGRNWSLGYMPSDCAKDKKYARARLSLKNIHWRGLAADPSRTKKSKGKI